MRNFFLAPMLALACSASFGQAADPSAILAEIARTMADARANPANASRVRCPANLGKLVGLPLGQIMIELGQPPQNSAGNVLVYPMAVSRPGESRGGGFPELTFKFDAKGVVSSVDCRQAR